MFRLLFLLATTQIELGGIKIDVEIADTPALRENGLSGRANLSDGSGMLFVFEAPQIAAFWMKDVSFPLSLGFFDAKKVLVQWIDMLTARNPPYPVYKSHIPILYALEVPMGWFRNNRIRPGMKFRYVEENSALPDQSNAVK